MRSKKYVKGVTLFMTTEMYDVIKEFTDKNQIGISEFIRALIDQHLESQRIASKTSVSVDVDREFESEEERWRNELY